jgi:hypothetical protein
LELQRDFKNRFTVLEGEKSSIINQIHQNLKNGYGAFDGIKSNDLTEESPSSSKVLEALKESGKLGEDTFPKYPVEVPSSSKVLEALKESGNLKEYTFQSNTEEKSKKDSIIEGLIDKGNSSIFDNSNKKDSIGDFKSITGSDSDGLSHSNDNDKQK